jgi:hypothetical protein
LIDVETIRRVLVIQPLDIQPIPAYEILMQGVIDRMQLGNA